MLHVFCFMLSLSPIMFYVFHVSFHVEYFMSFHVLCFFMFHDLPSRRFPFLPCFMYIFQLHFSRSFFIFHVHFSCLFFMFIFHVHFSCSFFMFIFHVYFSFFMFMLFCPHAQFHLYDSFAIHNPCLHAHAGSASGSSLRGRFFVPMRRDSTFACSIYLIPAVHGCSLEVIPTN